MWILLVFAIFHLTVIVGDANDDSGFDVFDDFWWEFLVLLVLGLGLYKCLQTDALIALEMDADGY